MFSALHLSADLGREPKRLAHCKEDANLDGVHPDSGLDTTSFPLRDLSLLSLFVEAGPYTMEPYQPDMNHRSMRHKCLIQTTYDEKMVSSPPLLSSMLQPNGENGFSGIGDICLAPYTVYDCEDEDEYLTYDSATWLKSCAPLTVKKDNDECDGHGFLAYRIAKDVSVEAWERMLAVFNLKRLIANGASSKGKKSGSGTPKKPISLASVVAFFRAIKPFSLKNRDEFIKMVKHFKWQHIYAYSDQFTHEQNCRFLTLTVQKFHDVRFSPMDGQHRIGSVWSCFIGRYFPDSTVRGSNMQAELFEYKDVIERFKKVDSVDPNGTFEYEEMQMFVNNVVKLCFPAANTSLVKSLPNMRNFGKKKTKQQEIVVRTKMCQEISQYLGNLQVKVKRREQLQALEPFTFQNVWRSGATASVVQRNCNLVWESLKKHIIDGDKVDYFTGGVGSKETPLSERMKLVDTAVRAKFVKLDHFGGKGREQTLKNCSQDLSGVLALFKYTFHSQEDLFLLYKWFRYVVIYFVEIYFTCSGFLHFLFTGFWITGPSLRYPSTVLLRLSWNFSVVVHS